MACPCSKTIFVDRADWSHQVSNSFQEAETEEVRNAGRTIALLLLFLLATLALQIPAPAETAARASAIGSSPDIVGQRMLNEGSEWCIWTGELRWPRQKIEEGDRRRCDGQPCEQSLGPSPHAQPDLESLADDQPCLLNLILHNACSVMRHLAGSDLVYVSALHGRWADSLRQFCVLRWSRATGLDPHTTGPWSLPTP